MSGSIKFDSNSLPNKSLSYLTGIDAFNQGGELGWESISAMIKRNITVRRVSISVPYSNGWHQGYSVSCALAGYTPILAIQNKFAGAANAGNIDTMGCNLSGNTIYFSYYSGRSDSGYLYMYFDVLYLKND